MPQASHSPVNPKLEKPVVMPMIDQAILIVTAGAQSGARMNLEIGRTYSVGVDESSEIVLRGAVSDTSSMHISLSSEGLQVSDDNNQDIAAAYHDELNFGSARFFIVKNNEPAALSVATPNNAIQGEPFKTDDNAAPANADEITTDTAASQSPQLEIDEPLVEQERAHVRNRFIRPLLYAGGIVAIGFASFAGFLWQSGSFEKSIAAAAPVEFYLAEAGFDYLNVERKSDITVITGYVQSRQQALNLAQVIAQVDAVNASAVLNRVLVDAEIQDQIEDVLRVNGIAGLVESLGEGAFVANTQLPLSAKLNGLQGLIESDVPSIASFSINNQIPDLPFVEPEPKNESIELDSGKRVVLVNSDKPAYVVTQDESRYFIGSILPGGYRITDILNGRVLLDKQGKTTELKF